VWDALQVGYGASLWLLLAGTVLIVALPVLRLLDASTRRDPTTATLVAVAVATVGSLLWTEVDFDSWEDLFPLLPLAALGIGAGPGRAGPTGARVAVAVATGGSLLWTEVDLDSGEDLSPLRPLAARGMGAGTAWGRQRLPHGAARAVGVAAVVVPTVLALHY